LAVAIVAGGIAVLAGTLVWVKPGVVCVSVMLVLSDAAASAACWDDAGKGKMDWLVEDTMSGGMGAFRMLLRMVGSLPGVEESEMFSWISPS
jgi:hypothetical protein